MPTLCEKRVPQLLRAVLMTSTLAMTRREKKLTELFGIVALGITGSCVGVVHFEAVVVQVSDGSRLLPAGHLVRHHHCAGSEASLVSKRHPIQYERPLSSVMGIVHTPDQCTTSLLRRSRSFGDSSAARQS